MSARAALVKALEDDARLSQLGFEVVYGQNAVDTPAEERFVVVRWETPDPPAYSTRHRGRVTVWFHDKSRDYSQIDLALQRMEKLVDELVHAPGADGWILTSAGWNGHSPDLWDDGFNTVTKWSDISVVSRYSSA